MGGTVPPAPGETPLSPFEREAGGYANPVAELFLLLVVLALVVAIVMFVAGVGPFANKKAQESGVDEEAAGSRPLHDIPHREQFAREKWRMFPPAR